MPFPGKSVISKINLCCGVIKYLDSGLINSEQEIA